MKLCRITASCIEDAFEMGCNRYCSTVGVYSNEYMAQNRVK